MSGQWWRQFGVQISESVRWTCISGHSRGTYEAPELGDGRSIIYGVLISVSRFENNFKLMRKGTPISFGDAPGAVLPFSPLRFSEKNIKLLRPIVMNYVVTPEEGTHYPKLFDTVSKGILHEYPFTAEGVQQAQTDLPRRKSTGRLIVKIDDYTYGNIKSTHGMACVPMY